MLGRIYIIKNTCNDKVYIGQTTRTIEARWADHIKNAIHNYQSSMIIYRAMRKYGVEHFFISILEDNIEKQDLNEREKYWIHYYNSIRPNGYNIRDGGDDSGRKEVYKIDPTTNEIVECYGSATAAAEANNLDLSSLSKICRREGNSCGGYKWTYKEYYDKGYLASIKTKAAKQPVYQVDPYTKEIINIFESISEAARYVNVNQSGISNVLSGKNHTAAGFGWCYVNEYKNYHPLTKTKQVIQLDKNNNIIKIWKDANEAAKKLNKNASSIRAVCNGKRKTVYGFKWKYKEQEEGKNND